MSVVLPAADKLINSSNYWYNL